MALRKILKEQYDYAKLRGWIPLFIAAAARFDFSTADLMGVSSRESNLKNIKGDFHSGAYHGFSLMQLDINSHREWIESGEWQDVGAAIFKGAEALAEKREQIIKASQQRSAKVRFRSGKTVAFTPRDLDEIAFRHCILAAYNCGIASYYHFSIGNDIDRGTTQQDYGRDVMARSEIFQSFLIDDNRLPLSPAIQRPAESVAEQESADREESPATVSPDTDVDLLGTAVSSDKARTLTKTFWAKHGGAATIWIGAMYELHQYRTLIVLVVVAAGLAWLVYHNHARVKGYVLTWLKK